jgi:hypothetical protein
MSRAKSRRSPITGSIVVADVVLANGLGRENGIRDENEPFATAVTCSLPTKYPR